MNVMAPLKVEEARIRVEMLQKEKQVYDLTHASDRIKAKLDLESSQEAFQMKQTANASEYMDLMRDGVLDDVIDAARNDPAQFVALSTALKDSPQGRNVQLREKLAQLEDVVAAREYSVKDAAGNVIGSKKGSAFLAPSKNGTTGVDALDDVQQNQLALLKQEAVEDWNANRIGGPLAVASLKKKRASDKIIASKVGELKAEENDQIATQIVQEAKATMAGLRKVPVTEVGVTGPISYDESTFGNLGDKDLEKTTVKFLAVQAAKLQEMIDDQTGKYDAGQKREFRKRLNINLTLQNEVPWLGTSERGLFAAGVGSAVGMAGQGWSLLYNRLFNSGKLAQEDLTKLRDIRAGFSLAYASQNEGILNEMTKRYNTWLNKFLAEKGDAVLLMNRSRSRANLADIQRLEAALGQPTPGLPPQVGGTGPAAGGVPSFASVEEANASGYKGSATVMGRPAMIR
jgi:hypothetical protein